MAGNGHPPPSALSFSSSQLFLGVVLSYSYLDLRHIMRIRCFFLARIRLERCTWATFLVFSEGFQTCLFPPAIFLANGIRAPFLVIFERSFGDLIPEIKLKLLVLLLETRSTPPPHSSWVVQSKAPDPQDLYSDLELVGLSDRPAIEHHHPRFSWNISLSPMVPGL